MPTGAWLRRFLADNSETRSDVGHRGGGV